MRLPPLTPFRVAQREPGSDSCPLVEENTMTSLHLPKIALALLGGANSQVGHKSGRLLNHNHAITF